MLTCILLVDLQVDVLSKMLGKSNCSGDTRNPSSNTNDSQLSPWVIYRALQDRSLKFCKVRLSKINHFDH
jgi:hypothetical protein